MRRGALVGTDRAQHRNRRNAVVGKHHGEPRARMPRRRLGNAVRHDPHPSRRVEARERVGRPARRSDQERRALDERPMRLAPRDDVDAGEGRLRGEARAAGRGIGLRTAVHPVGSQERDRRAPGVDVVHRVAERQVDRGERRQQAVATRGDVVHVDEADAQRRAQAAEEVAPGLVRQALEVEHDGPAVGAMRLDAPAVAHRDRDRVAAASARGRDQRAHVRLRAAALMVQHVQHPGRLRGVERQRRRVAQRRERIRGDVVVHERQVARMAREQRGGVLRHQRVLLLLERAPARVQHQRVVGQHVAPPGRGGAHAQVVLLAVAGAERGVEAADRVEHRATHEEAEPDAGRQVGIARHRRAGERAGERRGIGTCGPRVVHAEARVREDLGVVRPRRDRADRRVGRRAAQERLEPAVGHDRVAVEQHDVAAGQPHPAVGRPGESQVALVAHQLDVRMDRPRDLVEYARDARIGRCVVDQHEPIAGFRVREHALDAAAHVVRRVVDRHDDVDDVIRGHVVSRPTACSA